MCDSTHCTNADTDSPQHYGCKIVLYCHEAVAESTMDCHGLSFLYGRSLKVVNFGHDMNLLRRKDCKSTAMAKQKLGVLEKGQFLQSSIIKINDWENDVPPIAWP